MPAQRVDVRQQFLPGGLVQRGQGQADQVEPDAGHAGLGQRQQIRRRDVGRHHGDPAQPAGGAQRRDQMVVVGAQEAGLHQHAARHAVRVQQGQVLRQRRVVVRRVPARVGQRQSLAKDVRVSVDGGALQAGLQRVALAWGGRLFSVWRNSRKEGYSFLLLENVLFIPD